MTSKISVEITPLNHYNRYASSDYILCGIDFFIKSNGEDYHFKNESSNNCIKELLSEITDFLSGEISAGSELVYYVPWIIGNHCIYPYSFEIKDANTWLFRYKRNQNDTDFDFVCELDKDDIVVMQTQIMDQFAKIPWDSLGETQLCSFVFPEKEFVWCYSAKAFSNELNELCAGECIKKIYVSACNYSDPLRVEENGVYYYLGSELILQFEDFLIDLLIFAEGLFEWRVFKNTEYAIDGPTNKLIDDGDEEFCDIGDVYNMFTAEYTNRKIAEIIVDSTDVWPWNPKYFDESKLGSPVELPWKIHLCLSNGYELSLIGGMDDFYIQLRPN